MAEQIKPEPRWRPFAGIPFGSLTLLVFSLAAGAALSTLAIAPRTCLLCVAGAACAITMLRCPEIALAVYVVIGDLKGDDRLASLLPVDLTLVVGGILLAGIALNLVRRKPVSAMPSAYLLFLPLLTMMTLSLSYTPVFDAGLEKLGRFLTVTGIVIVAPFFVLSTTAAMRRFLIVFGAVAFVICSWSLGSLGGAERLSTPSDNTIGLGHIACALIILIWFAFIPRVGFPTRLAAYLFMLVPAVALIGSGSRGGVIACSAVILASLFLHPKRWLDVLWIVGGGAILLPFLNIPASSYRYLATLVTSHSAGELIAFRGDLFDQGWKLLQLHPLVGSGLQGFRYYAPNPELYKWPHNIFLETACELGIPAVLLTFGIFGAAVRAAFRQLKDRIAPHFVLSEIVAALFMLGAINATNTGDINSDRSTWLFLSLVFVAANLRSHRATVESASPGYFPVPECI